MQSNIIDLVASDDILSYLQATCKETGLARLDLKDNALGERFESHVKLKRLRHRCRCFWSYQDDEKL